MKKIYTHLILLLIFSAATAQNQAYLSTNQAELVYYSTPSEYINAEVNNYSPIQKSSFNNLTVYDTDTCPTGDVVITSQADIDALISCTEITGNLSIIGENITAGAETITDLSPLNNLTNIEGNIVIFNLPEITSLPTFENLTQLNGGYQISNLPLLTSLPNVPNQAIVNGNIQFSALPLVTELPTGLNTLTEIATGSDVETNTSNVGNLILSNLIGVSSLPSFSNLTNVNGSIDITGLSGLSSIPAFNNLTSARGISIIGNSAITTLGGFESLTNIDDFINIQNNSSLETVTGFNSLTFANQFLFASNNALVNLGGFNSMTEINRFALALINQSFTVSAFSSLDTLGFAQIFTMPLLTNLDFFSSVENLKFGLQLSNLPQLQSLSGLDNMSIQEGETIPENISAAISKSLSISNVPLPTTLGSIDLNTQNHFTNVSITTSPALANVDAFAGISGELNILTLSSLAVDNINFLSGITSVQQSFTLSQLSLLTDIQPIENIDFSNVSFFNISENPLLSQCDVDSVCAVLALAANTDENPDLNVIILNNDATGDCADLATAQNACGICETGNVVLTTQEEVDNFNCSFINGNLFITNQENPGDITNLNGLASLISIQGNISISETNLQNLNGLDNLTNVTGEISISSNPLLTDISALGNISGNVLGITLTNLDALQNLNGLENIDAVSGFLVINSNDALVNLNGLSGINSVGSDVTGVQALSIGSNAALTSLDGLEQLTNLNGNQVIVNSNPLLIDIEGIENIDEESVSFLLIANNANLSTCNVNFVCNYLALDGDNFNIVNNAQGCNNATEVDDLCTLSSEEFVTSDIQVYPNPFNSQLYIQLPEGVNHAKASIYTITGKQINRVHLTSNQHIISNLDTFPAGLYLLEIVLDNQQKLVYKLVK